MGLLHIITKNEHIRKLFGKREIVLIQKQLLGVALTQSEKNRLSRDIRKKLDAVQALAPHSGEFKVTNGAEIHRIIRESVALISTSTYRSRIKRIFLFGSTVDNTRTLVSDIDIAIYFSTITREEAVRFRLDMVKKLDSKVDIQVYNVLPKKIREEIDTKGKVLAL